MSRNQMQEMLKDDDGSGVLIRSMSISKLENATDHTVGMDESGSMSHFDQSTSSFAADMSVAANGATLPQHTRRARRSNSIRKIILRQDSVSFISSDEENPDPRSRSRSKDPKDRRPKRNGSLKIVVTRKSNSDTLDPVQKDPNPQPRRSISRSTKTDRRSSGSRSPARTPAVSKDSPRNSPKTPKGSNRRSLRAKSFNFVAPLLSLTPKRDADLALARQESASRIKELDDLLASKSPKQSSKPTVLAPKSPSTCSSTKVHSWDGALAHVTPNRGRRRRVEQTRTDIVEPASTRAILSAYDQMMKEFDGEASTRSLLDTNTGW